MGSFVGRRLFLGFLVLEFGFFGLEDATLGGLSALGTRSFRRMASDKAFFSASSL
jgi:hypothetical protein